MNPRLAIPGLLSLGIHVCAISVLPGPSSRAAVLAEHEPATEMEPLTYISLVDEAPIAPPLETPAPPPSEKSARISAQVPMPETRAKEKRTRARPPGSDARTFSDAPAPGAGSEDQGEDPRGGAKGQGRKGGLRMRNDLGASLLDRAIANADGPSAYPGEYGGANLAGEGRAKTSSEGSTRAMPWRSRKGGTYEAEGEPFYAKIHEDGRIEFRDKAPVDVGLLRGMHGIPLPALVGKFDLTDAAIKSIGGTLYPYRKMQRMDASRDMRAAMARNWRSKVLRRSLDHHRRELGKIHARNDLSEAQKRELYFLLWDECAEFGDGDEEQRLTAERVRAITIAFVRKNYPHGSPAEYSQAELEALNERRKSRARFLPYSDDAT